MRNYYLEGLCMSFIYFLHILSQRRQLPAANKMRECSLKPCQRDKQSMLVKVTNQERVLAK